jgi:Ser/Thr protein kinase RdoA (MazF antagonist)
VPRVFPTNDGRTVVPHLGRFWELQEWMPGRADFYQLPSKLRLENACIALARLHLLWSQLTAEKGPCPAVARRLDGLCLWSDFASACRRLVTNETLRPYVERAKRVLVRWLSQIPTWLDPWTHPLFFLHPCLCDVWHDHVLYEQDRVSGLIDYGAVKVDHASVDLARLLGSLVEDDVDAWRTGLAAYRTVRPLSEREEQLARVLDVTGTVLGVANWLRRMASEKWAQEEEVRVAHRLETLVARMERWVTQSPLAALRYDFKAASGERQRLENWKLLRAPLRPYFLRSFMRLSRVR